MEENLQPDSKRNGPRLRRLPTGKVRKPVRVNTGVFGKILAKVPASIRKPFGVLVKLIGKIVPPYFKNSWVELKQVTWPNRSETWRLTMAVFIFAIIFGLAILGVDKVLDFIFKKVVIK